MARFIALLALTLCVAIPSKLLAWGQPGHACISWDTVERHGQDMPRVCTDPATRDTYLHASYSPDQYLLHGPEYVHVDRQFSLLLFKHAKDPRQLALAYGWSSHQEQDAVGHGRYVTDSGFPHILKEMIIDTRFLFEGSGGESRAVREAGSAWDAELIEAATTDYAAKYGSKYQTIDRGVANTTGYVFAAYMTALKGAMYALWYGRIKWDKNQYPRSAWSRFVDEGVVQTSKWCKDPFSFVGSSEEMSRSEGFGSLFKDAARDEVSINVKETAPVSSEETLARIGEAMKAYEARRQWSPMPSIGVRRPGDVPASHALLQESRFVRLGHSLLKSPGAQVIERVSGSYRDVRVRIKNKKRFLKDLDACLKADQPTVPSGLAGQSPSDPLFGELSKDAEKAVGNVDESSED